MNGHLPGSSVQRRRITLELREARTRAQLTQRETADSLGWSESKLLRIESGQVRISRTDLKAMLELYGIPERHAELAPLAEESRVQPWSRYRDVLRPEFARYLGFEAASAEIRQFELLVVPGILQTRAYAEAVIRAFAPPGTSEATVRRQVDARMARQEPLARAAPPRMHLILDEAVLCRRVGAECDSPTVMREQLSHLKGLAARRHVRIQLVPFDRGLHFGLAGAFVILNFDDDPGLVYVENARATSALKQSEDDVAEYRAVFDRLTGIALSSSDSAKRIDEAIHELT